MLCWKSRECETSVMSRRKVVSQYGTIGKKWQNCSCKRSLAVSYTDRKPTGKLCQKLRFFARNFGEKLKFVTPEFGTADFFRIPELEFEYRPVPIDVFWSGK